MSSGWIVKAQCIVVAFALFAGDLALAKTPFVLASGRRDPRIYAIDLNAALKPENNNTPNAIVSRSLVSPRRLDGALLGDPANIVLSDDQSTAYVMNHHGSIVNAEFLQHGGRANISIMDVKKMLRREFDNTDAAVLKIVDAGWFGGVGLIALPDLIIASTSEGWLGQDGSNRISLIDPKTGGLVGQIQMALVGPGTRQLNPSCAAFPVPFISPTPPPATYSYLGPSHAFGCWPNPQFIALGKGSDGKTYLLSGNGGTEDVSVMDLQKALTGAPVVEVAPRIPVQAGPFGIAASPDGKFVAATARQNNRTGVEGNTISIIDVDLARQGLPGAEAARVQVGTDGAGAQARPFSVAWTPDGKEILVANTRVNNVSIVDLGLALAHKAGAEIARIALTRPDGAPARPKVVAVTAEGRYAVVTGGDDTLTASATNPTGMVYVIDLGSRSVATQVTGVGIDPYGVTVVDDAD
jgi:DNA-binding beta-propeller fold protein YncE